jgi:hypothetical protein
MGPKPPDQPGVGDVLSPSDRLSIARAAVLAPSADNRHCFALQASGERILLFGNDAYLSAPFHRKILGLISFGAVAENMRVRAASLGYQTHFTWLPDPTDPSLIAALGFARADHSEHELDAAISRRHTNRCLSYHGPRLSEPELTGLSKGVAAIEGVSLQFMDSPASRSKLLQLLRIAEAERFNTRSMHQDLFFGIRFDVGWHGSAEEGLPPGVLGVEPGARWAFRQLARWPVMSVLRRIGLHRALGFRAADLPCRFAPHRGVIATHWPVDRGAISVGVALERLWLEAESRGLAFQPFAGPALLALPGYADVPSAIGQRLREGWSELTTGTGTPLMVFRLGWAARPGLRTQRPPFERYLRSG